MSFVFRLPNELIKKSKTLNALAFDKQVTVEDYGRGLTNYVIPRGKPHARLLEDITHELASHGITGLFDHTNTFVRTLRIKVPKAMISESATLAALNEQSKVEKSKASTSKHIIITLLEQNGIAEGIKTQVLSELHDNGIVAEFDEHQALQVRGSASRKLAAASASIRLETDVFPAEVIHHSSVDTSMLRDAEIKRLADGTVQVSAPRHVLMALEKIQDSIHEKSTSSEKKRKYFVNEVVSRVEEELQRKRVHLTTKQLAQVKESALDDYHRKLTKKQSTDRIVLALLEDEEEKNKAPSSRRTRKRSHKSPRPSKKKYKEKRRNQWALASKARIIGEKRQRNAVRSTRARSKAAKTASRSPSSFFGNLFQRNETPARLASSPRVATSRPVLRTMSSEQAQGPSKFERIRDQIDAVTSLYFAVLNNDKDFQELKDMLLSSETLPEYLPAIVREFDDVGQKEFISKLTRDSELKEKFHHQLEKMTSIVKKLISAINAGDNLDDGAARAHHKPQDEIIAEMLRDAMTTPDDIVVALKELPQTEQEKVASAITRVVKSDPVLQVRYASLLNWLNDLWRNIKRTFWSMFNFVNLNAHDDE